jgi:GT2 family glycosyltransferase
MIDVSIIIVSYNVREDLARCLASLHDHPPRASHEIVVVDNDSTDGSAAEARRWPGVRVVEMGGNR